MFYNYPIFFEQNRVFRVYKGGKLFSDFFSDDSEDGNYPEEWVISSVHALNEGSTDKYEGISKIKGEDLYLNDALDKYKKKIIGERDDLGVLTKILDSAIRLPVQGSISTPLTARRKAGTSSPPVRAERFSTASRTA